MRCNGIKKFPTDAHKVSFRWHGMSTGLDDDGRDDKVRIYLTFFRQREYINIKMIPITPSLCNNIISRATLVSRHHRCTQPKIEEETKKESPTTVFQALQQDNHNQDNT